LIEQLRCELNIGKSTDPLCFLCSIRQFFFETQLSPFYSVIPQIMRSFYRIHIIVENDPVALCKVLQPQFTAEMGKFRTYCTLKIIKIGSVLMGLFNK